MNTGGIPRIPGGNSKGAEFERWSREKLVNESRLNAVSGHRVINSTTGKTIIPSARAKGSSASVSMLKIRSVEDDYLVCRDWDGTTIGSEDIYVAKPYKLRCSLESEEVYGETHSYTYADDEDEPFMEFGDAIPEETYNVWGEEQDEFAEGGDLFEKRLNVIRTVNEDGNIETQRVAPPWLKGDVVFAIECDATGVTVGGDELDFLLIGDNRMWART